MPVIAMDSGHAWDWVMERREGPVRWGTWRVGIGPWRGSAASGRILNPWRVGPSIRSATIVKAR